MIAVIDVSGNNLSSLANALKRLGCPFELTHDAQTIRQASHVILPGVGTAHSGMRALGEHGLINVIKSLTQPVLGICLGMQLLLDFSEEGDVDCLGVIPGRVELLRKTDNFPVPHMGWNQLDWKNSSPLQKGLLASDCLYFVHSYGLKTSDNALATCEYSESFAAIINKANFYGMQFHPEKSAQVGAMLLRNFCELL